MVEWQYIDDIRRWVYFGNLGINFKDVVQAQISGFVERNRFYYHKRLCTSGHVSLYKRLPHGLFLFIRFYRCSQWPDLPEFSTELVFSPIFTGRHLSMPHFRIHSSMQSTSPRRPVYAHKSEEELKRQANEAMLDLVREIHVRLSNDYGPLSQSDEIRAFVRFADSTVEEWKVYWDKARKGMIPWREEFHEWSADCPKVSWLGVNHRNFLKFRKKACFILFIMKHRRKHEDLHRSGYCGGAPALLGGLYEYVERAVKNDPSLQSQSKIIEGLSV